MHKVHFTKEALFDIETVVLWYEEKRLGLSYDFELCLESGIEEVLKKSKGISKEI